MKQIGFFFLASLLVIATSCVDNGFSAGSSLVDEQVQNVIVDTTTISLKTVLEDSTRTSGISRIFMGRYESSDFGTTEAESFLTFGVPSYSSAVFNKESTATLVMDSICLVLTYDKYSYGDTTKTQTINISKLTERMDESYKSHSSAFYNTNSIEAESTPYVTKTFQRPISSSENDSTLFVRLPDAFGRALMDSMMNQSAIFESATNFMLYFKGFKLSAGRNDKYCVNSFKASSSAAPVIRIYYHNYTDLQPTEETISMTANTTYAFSHIAQDRSNTSLKDLTGDNDISSAITGHKAYIQGMTGMYTEMTFPYISDLNLHGRYTNVASAYIYIYPPKGTYDDFTPLPKTMTLNFVNKLGDVKDIYATTTSPFTAGVLTDDPLSNVRYYYAFDVTSFIQSEIAAAEDDKGTLQLTLSDTDKANTLKSLIIGDSSFPNKDYQIKLVIQLLIKDYD